MRIVHSRSRQSSTTAPSNPPVNSQRKVGRRSVTSPSDIGATGRGKPLSNTHTPPNNRKPIAQLSVHAPDTHAGPPFAPLGQTLPHRPQFITEKSVLVSQPLAAFMSQLAKPVLHVLKPQLPPPQLGAALARAGHAMPQLPQCIAESFRLLSQPLEKRRSQSPKPMLQLAIVHAPMVHWGVALAGAFVPVQLAPQRPQFVSLVLRLASQPFSRLPSQSPNPAAHRRPQVPRSQTAVPFAWSAH